DAVVPGATITALLTLDIIDGWHTYWKNPGDSGEATRIDWTLPEGVTAGEIRWPTPHRIPYSGFINYGYEGVAHHLVTLTVSDTVATGRTLPLSASATWLVCEDICIPETGTFELVVRTTDRLVPGSTSSPAFAAARAQLPSEAGPVSARRDGADAVFDLTGLPPLVDVYFFPDDWGVVEPGATQTLNDGTLRLAGATLGDAPVSGVLTGLTADDRRVGLSISASLGATTAAPTAAPAADIGLPTALLFALLGGVILNLMPCVFPVLSMKAMHLVNSDDAQSARTDGLAYTAGVLVFFAVLGIALLALRASGDAIGWGFQLQSPPVVGALALLMFLIGLNLMGAFDIGGAFMGAGSSLAGRGGAVGAFFTGALAAIVATPCTAPFMGVALGFALTQPAPVALTVLLTLGLGLALPFLVVALVPALAARLPRPGAWMNTLRQALAFPMFGAAVWLAWVLALQTGPDGVLRLLSAAVIAALAVWLWPRRRHHVAAALCAAAAAACLVAVGTLQPGATGTALTDDTQKRGVAFSPERLSAARAAGDTVFVNQTAAWCLTCLVNEKNVLSTSRVESALRAPGVTYMSGDWTRRDPDITAFLSEHGRSGVPLYVVYHGNAPGVVLPPVLTESIVLDALERPAGTAQISNGARLSATLRQPKLRQP
ncbi:MAG: protein-disulfide reductase DsbD domain-containing protein, partial [Pseudomonadota bacterium]